MNTERFNPVIKALPMVHGEVSIQASNGHYCSPRNDAGPYSNWELRPEGCPAEALALLEDYSDGDSSIYAYVPTKVVAAFVKACGGAKGMLLHPFALHSDCATRALMPERRKILSAWRSEQ